MKERHANRLQKGKCTITNGYIFNDLVADMERVSDHCSNIGIVIIELKEDALDVHEMSDLIYQAHPHHYEENFNAYMERFYPVKWNEADAS